MNDTVLPDDYFFEFLGNKAPIDEIHFEGEIRFRKGFFRQRQRLHGQRHSGHNDQIEIRMPLGVSPNPRTEGPHLIARQMIPQDLLDQPEVVRA